MAEPQIADSYEIDETKPIIFAPCEWYFFKEEIKNQIAENKGVDILKALHNARYYAMLDRSSKQIADGKVLTFTDKEWEAFVNALDIH